MEKQEIIHYALQYFCHLRPESMSYRLINNITHIIVGVTIENIEYKVYLWDSGIIRVFNGENEVL